MHSYIYQQKKYISFRVRKYKNIGQFHVFLSSFAITKGEGHIHAMIHVDFWEKIKGCGSYRLLYIFKHETQ